MCSLFIHTWLSQLDDSFTTRAVVLNITSCNHSQNANNRTLFFETWKALFWGNITEYQYAVDWHEISRPWEHVCTATNGPYCIDLTDVSNLLSKISVHAKSASFPLETLDSLSVYSLRVLSCRSERQTKLSSRYWNLIRNVLLFVRVLYVELWFMLFRRSFSIVCRVHFMTRILFEWKKGSQRCVHACSSSYIDLYFVIHRLSNCLFIVICIPCRAQQWERDAQNVVKESQG